MTSGDSASGMAMAAGAARAAESETENELAPNVSEPQKDAIPPGVDSAAADAEPGGPVGRADADADALRSGADLDDLSQ